MAPRKSAAAAGEEDGPNLTLIVEKGPLSGQRNEFRPGSLVHIGRHVRGNTLSIEDAGISSKHLRIQFAAAADPDSRHWIITDLGPSNGTVMNGKQVDPSEPVRVSDGDVIKIGEQTSIKVMFEVRGAENKIESSSGNVRRNTRRRVRVKVCNLVVIEEDAELGLQKKEDEEEMEKVVVVEAKQGRNVSTRRTRNSAKNEKLAKDEEDRDLGPSGIRGSRGVCTRNARKAELGLQKKEDEGEIEKVAVVAAKQGRNVSTRTKNSAKNENLARDEEDRDLGPSGIRGSRGVSTRRTRNAELGLQKKEDKEEIEKVAVVEAKQGRNVSTRTRNSAKNDELAKDEEDRDLRPSGIRRSPEVSTRKTRNARMGKNVRVNETTIEVKNSRTDSSSGLQEGNEEEPNPDHKTREEVKERSEAGVDELCTEMKISGRVAAGVKQSKGKMVLDLENMTLGEWLDFLDVHEPQEIINQTEAMLTEMRRKAERCYEYRLQHKNAKAVE